MYLSLYVPCFGVTLFFKFNDLGGHLVPLSSILWVTLYLCLYVPRPGIALYPHIPHLPCPGVAECEITSTLVSVSVVATG